MKSLLTLLLVFLLVPVFGQTKSDFVNCLELVFNHSQFEPANNNSYDLNNGFVIISTDRSFNRNRLTSVNQILQELAQDDFYDSDHRVKVVRQDDVEPLGLVGEAALNLVGSGTESSILIRVSTIVRLERLQYTWDYKFDKIEDEWEISATSISTQKALTQN